MAFGILQSPAHRNSVPRLLCSIHTNGVGSTFLMKTTRQAEHGSWCLHTVSKVRGSCYLIEGLRNFLNMRRFVTTRLVCDKSSLEKSTRLLEMSGGERLEKNCVCEDCGGHEAA